MGRQRNPGFVSFYERDAAQKAMDRLNGAEFEGSELRINWSKPVKSAGVPIVFAPDAQQKVEAALRLGPSGGLGFSSRIPPTGPVLDVEVPSELDQRKLIDRVAEYVGRYGYDFEAALREREKNDPKYDFLLPSESPAHVYYKWRAYSLAQGDTLVAWRTEPFQLFEGSNPSDTKALTEPRIRPPPLDVVQPKKDQLDEATRGRLSPDPPPASSRSGEKSGFSKGDLGGAGGLSRVVSREITLNDDEYDEFSGILRGLSVGREHVLEGILPLFYP